MRGPAYAVLVVLTLLAPNVAAADVWRGQIRCVVLQGLNMKPLVGDFQMTRNGTRLTYSRPVHIADSPSLSGVEESGAGSLNGNEIELQGGASGRGYSYTASYQGRVENGYANLAGEQVWTTSKSGQFHRACHITLAPAQK